MPPFVASPLPPASARDERRRERSAAPILSIKRVIHPSPHGCSAAPISPTHTDTAGGARGRSRPQHPSPPDGVPSPPRSLPATPALAQVGHPPTYVTYAPRLL